MHYRNLFIMMICSCISMYILMYIMVDRYANVYSNLNQLYMAALMTIPMLIIELLLMKTMYPKKILNSILLATSGILFIALLFFIRNQTAITDTQFVKSMIPHHAAALLMCEKAKLQNPKLKQLCANILRTQQEEIDLMKQVLAEQ